MSLLGIVVLLKIIALKHSDWKQKNLANWLQISASKVSKSLNRSELEGVQLSLCMSF